MDGLSKYSGFEYQAKFLISMRSRLNSNRSLLLIDLYFKSKSNGFDTRSLFGWNFKAMFYARLAADTTRL